jgi:hypothetical protein
VVCVSVTEPTTSDNRDAGSATGLTPALLPMSNGENDNSVRENLCRLRERLTREVAKPVEVDYLKGEITRILRVLGKKPGSPEDVAQRIAQELAPKLTHAGNNLRRLIENRPAELSAALQASFLDDLPLLVKALLADRKTKKSKSLSYEDRRILKSVRTGTNTLGDDGQSGRK